MRHAPLRGRCLEGQLRFCAALRDFPGRIKTDETQNVPFVHIHKTTFAKTSPKQRAPISRFIFNALNGNNTLALIHGIQNDARPDESSAVPQKRDEVIGRKRIGEGVASSTPISFSYASSNLAPDCSPPVRYLRYASVSRISSIAASVSTTVNTAISQTLHASAKHPHVQGEFVPQVRRDDPPPGF